MAYRGQVSEFALQAMETFPFWRQWRAGAISRQEYIEALRSRMDLVLEQLGGDRHLFTILSRYPSDFDRNADEILDDLVAEGLVPAKPPAAPFELFRERVRTEFDHGANSTYINPDEARLLYFISMAVKPRRMAVVGSYYGYWTIWAMPGVEAGGGEATLMDPNRSVCELAEKNFQALGFGERTRVRAEKAENVLPEMADDLDMVLLDANGGAEYTDPTLRGKGLYGLIAERVFDKMRPGALLVAHNDYLPSVGSNPLAENFLKNASAQLNRFHEFCGSHFRKSRVAFTPDGFGVYMK